jgi:hypothetical protein
VKIEGGGMEEKVLGNVGDVNHLMRFTPSFEIV